MTEVAVTERAHSVRGESADHRGARRRGARVKGELPRKPVHLVSFAGMEEAVRIVRENEPGRKYKARRDEINNIVNLVQLFQRWGKDTGNGTGYSNHFEITRELYGPDKIRTRQDADAMWGTVWRWKTIATRAGLLSLEEVVKRNGASDCVCWELLDPRVDSERGADVAQLARAPLCELRRRRERPTERVAARHRPYGRRTGRQGVPRLVRQGGSRRGPLSFSSQESALPSRPSPPLRGGKVKRDSGGRARGALSRRELAALVDRAHAALAARRNSSCSEEGGFETLAALPWLAQLPATALGKVAVELFLPEATPAISAKRQRQLEAAYRRLNRYANFGHGSPTAGAEAILDIAGGDHHEWLKSPPRSLGAIAICMRRLANKWRADEQSRRDPHNRKSPAPVVALTRHRRRRRKARR